jgi:hypothetical protein
MTDEQITEQARAQILDAVAVLCEVVGRVAGRVDAVSIDISADAAGTLEDLGGRRCSIVRDYGGGAKHSEWVGLALRTGPLVTISTDHIVRDATAEERAQLESDGTPEDGRYLVTR